MKKYLFFDTETTGLPKRWDLPAANTDNWPRLVQIAWIIDNEDGDRLYQQSSIIKPEGFKIPEDASKIHRITTEIALEKGEELKEVLKKLAVHLVKCDCIVAHNIAFDEKIIEAEMIRKKVPISFQHYDKVCTMLQSVNFCKKQGPYGYKWPRLQELYIDLFEEDFEEAHNAFADISATAKCFWELKRIGVIK
jgi:DNA polymerase III alpha subunit (gram-positive type)